MRIKYIRQYLSLFLLFGFFIQGCNLITDLQLSPESRLPSWLPTLQNYSRGDLLVTIKFYNYIPSHPIVKIIVYGPKHEKLIEKKGTFRWHPLIDQQMKQQSAAIYPLYFIIAVDGIEDVYVQQHRSNYLYITDDPTLTHALKKP